VDDYGIAGLRREIKGELGLYH